MNVSLRTIKGPKADAIAQVNACAEAPEALKSFLTWLIQNNPGAGVTLDAHAMDSADSFSSHITVKKLY